MSEEQLGFLEAAKTDAVLQEKLKEATDSDAVVALVKAAGFVISAKDLETQASNTISPEELEGLWWVHCALERQKMKLYDGDN